MEAILSLDQALDKILNREISVRQASEQSGYSRDFIRAELNRRYANDKDELKFIEAVMKENKDNSSTIEIDQDLLEQIFFKVINKEMLLKDAQVALGNIDIQTMKEKFAQLVEQTENLEIPNKYLKFLESQNRDYSKINFRVLAIDMMRLNLTQCDIAHELGIQPRTVSREFEKLKYDKDKRLYDLLKAYGEMKAKKHKFTEDEMLVLDRLLTDYEEHNSHLLVLPEKSKEEILIEREDYLVSESEKLKALGLTQAQIAKKLQTSISTLRRARISQKQRKVINRVIYEDREEK